MIKIAILGDNDSSRNTLISFLKIYGEKIKKNSMFLVIKGPMRF